MVVSIMTDHDTTITRKNASLSYEWQKLQNRLKSMFLFSDFLAVKIKRLSSHGLKDPGWFTRFYQQQLLVERRKERYTIYEIIYYYISI